MTAKFHNKSTLLIMLLFLFPSILPAQINAKKIKSVDYCSLFPDELKNYESEIIKTRGLMIYSNVPRVDDGDSFFYLPQCNSADNFAVVNFENLEDSGKKWNQFFDNLSENRIYIFEVNFIGKLKTSIIPSFGHLSWSRAKSEVIKIESIKDVSKSVKKPDFDADADLIDQGKSLQTISSETIFFFSGNKNSFEIDENIATEFVLIDFQGEKYSKSNYKEFSKNDFFKGIENYSSRTVSGGEAKRMGDEFKIEGFIKFSDSQNREKRFDYENTFILKNDLWILTESKFTMP